MLDDELFADRHREIGARRQRAERPAELLAFERHPGRHAAALSELDGLDDHLLLPALLVDAHDLADFQQVRWNRDDPAGPCDVTVQDKLARLCERTRKAEPINNVIEPPFEQHQQVLTGDSGHPLGNFEVLRKLLFEQPVNPLDLLLFTQADRELREAGARLSMRSWRIITPFDRALVSIATLALQEELQAFAPAHPADWSKISSHDIPLLAPASDPAPFWRAASVVRYRGHVLDRNYRESGGLKRADRGFAAAICAANGVPLRDPLKPTEPALDHATTRPSGSVIVTIVLLKVACTWATPSGTARRVRRLRRGAAGAAPAAGADPVAAAAAGALAAGAV